MVADYPDGYEGSKAAPPQRCPEKEDGANFKSWEFWEKQQAESLAWFEAYGYYTPVVGRMLLEAKMPIVCGKTTMVAERLGPINDAIIPSNGRSSYGWTNQPQTSREVESLSKIKALRLGELNENSSLRNCGSKRLYRRG